MAIFVPSMPSGLGGVLRALWTAQWGNCFHCGAPMRLGGEDDSLHWSREHIHPRRPTGDRRSYVFVLAHRCCNERRGNRALADEERGRVIAILDSIAGNCPSDWRWHDIGPRLGSPPLNTPFAEALRAHPMAPQL